MKNRELANIAKGLRAEIRELRRQLDERDLIIEELRGLKSCGMCEAGMIGHWAVCPGTPKCFCTGKDHEEGCLLNDLKDCEFCRKEEEGHRPDCPAPFILCGPSSAPAPHHRQTEFGGESALNRPFFQQG